MLRFASSPTADMSIGDLRVAILNYIVAKQRGEEFIVRIEDTDKEKNIEGKDQEILDLLALFQIEYSRVTYQSESVRFHSAMALQLMHDKKAFACFCSPEWLEKKRQESKAANRAYKYDDACRNLPAELVIDNMNPFTVRVTKPDGDISLNPDALDSFVIMSQEKRPTYDFSCAVDDMLADISVVINDDDYPGSTSKQEHIRDSLKYDKKIEYINLAQILSDEPVTLKSLLEEGFLPSAISNYLISTTHNSPKKIFEMKDAIEWFDINTISKSPTHFDIELLRDINKEHLQNLDAKELSRYVGFADEEIGELARIYLEEAKTTKELKSKIAPIFAPKLIPENLQEQTKAMAITIQAAPYFEEYDDFKNYILQNSQIESENFSKLLHLLLTGAEDGPDITKIYKYLKNYIGEIIK